MTYAVKCPICTKIKLLVHKPSYFFKCCGISHDFNDNLVVEGYRKNKEKNKKVVEKGEKGVNNDGTERNNEGKDIGTGTERKGTGKDTTGKETVKIV